ncbi:MAG TPA: STAS/SEC14 domain-containing protein [Thermoanaerobaculia bacterium]|jgi:hypothetical protein
MKSRWIEQRGRRILYCDYSGFRRDVEQLHLEIAACDEAIAREQRNSVLALVDLRGTSLSVETLGALKQSALHRAPYIEREAVVGLTAIQAVLIQAVANFAHREYRLFDTTDDAQEWLAEGGPQGSKVTPQKA